MPRVNTKSKSTRGATRSCGRCGREIKPGETYFSWSFRHGGTHYRCADHYPRPSELTQSKLSEVYGAVEDAEDNMAVTETVEDVKALVDGVAEVVQQVAEEYREAAEPFGGQGENADKAEELDGWLSELQSFDPEEPHEADPEPVEEPEPEPKVADPETPRETRYDVQTPVKRHQQEREVYRTEFDQLGGTWAVVAYDQWYVDEHGQWEEDGGVMRRVKIVPPAQASGGGADLIAGYSEDPDHQARHERIVGKPEPTKPRPALSPEDALARAREEATGLIGGCPL